MMQKAVKSEVMARLKLRRSQRPSPLRRQQQQKQRMRRRQSPRIQLACLRSARPRGKHLHRPPGAQVLKNDCVRHVQNQQQLRGTSLPKESLRPKLETWKACERRNAVRRREEWQGQRLKAWLDLVPEVTEQLKILRQRRHRHRSKVVVADGDADPEGPNKMMHPQELQLQHPRTPGLMRRQSRHHVLMVTGTGGLPICHRLQHLRWDVHPRLKKHGKNKKNHRDDRGRTDKASMMMIVQEAVVDLAEESMQMKGLSVRRLKFLLKSPHKAPA